MRASVAGRFVGTGVVLYCATVGVLWRDTSLSFAADLLWAILVATGVLVLVAGWYWVAVRNAGGRRGDAWSLPDAPTIAVRVPTAQALARVRTLSERAFPAAHFEMKDGDLLITKPGGWWIGDSTICVSGKATSTGSALRFVSESLKLVNGGVCRGMIGRLLTDLSKATVLDEDGVQQPLASESLGSVRA